MNDTQLFIVLMDAEGIFRPMAFIAPFTEMGKLAAKDVKLQEGDRLVIVEMVVGSDFEA